MNSKINNKGLIILAGGSIGHRLPFIQSAAVNPAMIPVGLRPAIAYLFEFYADHVSEIIVVCNPSSAHDIQIQWDIVSRAHHSKVSLKIIAKDTSHVLDSLRLASAEANHSNIQDWIISPVTTIPTMLVNPHAYLVEQDIRASAGWSFLLRNADQIKFVSRNSNNQSQSGHAFTGIFQVSKIALSNALAELTGDDLIRLIACLVEKDGLTYLLTDWIDIGHAVNYYQAKSKIVASRHFNSIEIDTVKGLVLKKSNKIKKILDEATYVATLPKEIQLWFPRQIGEVHVKDGYANQLMEYYAYPVVSELFLYWHLDLSQWRQFMSSMRRLLSDFKSHLVSVSKSEHDDLYLNKLITRVDNFFLQVKNSYPAICNEGIVVNGEKNHSLDFLRPWVEKFCDQLYRQDDHCIMHGDLCFNNILYDPYGGTIRLIDPRGGMSSSGGNLHSGDVKYDLAKFVHSAIYGYDFVVSGQFKFEVHNGEYFYEIFSGINSATMLLLVDDLLSDLKVNRNEIDFIVALLFMSMASLHSEDLRRQVVMYLHGLSILNKVYKKYAHLH